MTAGGCPIRPDRATIHEIQFDVRFTFVRPRRWRIAGANPIVWRDCVVPRVDGELLTDLIDRFELESGMEPAGGKYGGIEPGDSRAELSDHFYGTVAAGWNSTTAVLACQCGIEGCWPLLAEITVAEDLVIWDDFAQPYRATRAYTGFGPFRFDRSRYDAALRAVSAPIRSNYPPVSSAVAQFLGVTPDGATSFDGVLGRNTRRPT